MNFSYFENEKQKPNFDITNYFGYVYSKSVVKFVTRINMQFAH